MIAILLLVPLAIAEAILRKRRQKKLRRANEQLQREARAQTRSQNRQRQTPRHGNTVPIQQGTGAPQYCDDTALPTYEEAIKQTQPMANKKAAKKTKKAKKQSPVVQRDNNLYVIQRQECSSRMWEIRKTSGGAIDGCSYLLHFTSFLLASRDRWWYPGVGWDKERSRLSASTGVQHLWLQRFSSLPSDNVVWNPCRLCVFLYPIFSIQVL